MTSMLWMLTGALAVLPAFLYCLYRLDKATKLWHAYQEASKSWEAAAKMPCCEMRERAYLKAKDGSPSPATSAGRPEGKS